MTATQQTTEPTPRERMQAIIDALGLSIRAEFVPFSQSRNKAEKSPSLNWRVTLLYQHFTGPRDIFTTDYSAGCAHCPAYKAKGLGLQNSIVRDDAVRRECETGKTHLARDVQGGFHTVLVGKPILPDTVDVIHSLVLDSDVLNYSGFEDWASNFGYDTDSRKAESIYRQCLEHALALRNAIGQDNLDALIKAGEDY